MIIRCLNLFLFKLKNPSCEIHYSTRVSRKAAVGKNCKIGKNATLTASVILGDNVSIGQGVNLSKIKINSNTVIEGGVKIVGTGKGIIVIGKECYIGVNNILDNSDNITIGDFVHIAGPSTGLWCHSSAQMCLNSVPVNDPDRDQFRPTNPIFIDSNVYVGGNCTIYPGTKLAHHSIIAPNSAVNKNVDSNIMVGGVPAKFIKKIM